LERAVDLRNIDDSSESAEVVNTLEKRAREKEQKPDSKRETDRKI
jgi:hypothetical protein